VMCTCRHGRPSTPACFTVCAVVIRYGKNADLAAFTQDELNAVAAKLNHRPRRVLGWATPAEAFGIAQPKPMLRAPA
jgi:hypothetical protein